VRETSSRHALPATLGGRALGADETFFEANATIAGECEFRVTRLTEEFSLENWLAMQPDAVPMAELGPGGTLRLLGPGDKLRGGVDAQVLSRMPKRPERQGA
jgi:hypothetical protein